MNISVATNTKRFITSLTVVVTLDHGSLLWPTVAKL
jgi:hypothetical protein